MADLTITVSSLSALPMPPPTPTEIVNQKKDVFHLSFKPHSTLGIRNPWGPLAPSVESPGGDP